MSCGGSVLSEELMQPRIECVARTRDVCGEGVVWSPVEDAVYWTDINRRLLHRCRLGSKTVDTWEFDQPVTAVTLTSDAGLLLIVLGGRVILWDVASEREIRTVFKLVGWPAIRCNDARVDRGGVLWIGTMQNNVRADGGTSPVTEAVGQLISVDAGGNARTWREGVGIANTVAWSPDGEVLYFGDTLRNRIDAFDFAAGRGILSGPRRFAAGLDRGLPDGSAIDSEGCLWNCRFGGGCIVRFAQSGSVDRVVETAVPNPTTCTFGSQDMRTLYFTSAAGEAARSSDAEEENGGLFRMRVDVPGLACTPFAL